MATDDRIRPTVLLYHDPSKTLDEIMGRLRKTGFYRAVPPQGGERVSWTVAMSDGSSSTGACRRTRCTH